MHGTSPLLPVSQEAVERALRGNSSALVKLVMETNVNCHKQSMVDQPKSFATARARCRQLLDCTSVMIAMNIL